MSVVAVVDILTTSGDPTRIRVTGETAQAVEETLDKADEMFQADDMALVSLTGAKPEEIGFNNDEEPYDWWYLPENAPVTDFIPAMKT